jgi:hypothetical protein
MEIGIEKDTIDEVVRTGHTLLALCQEVPADDAPDGFRRAVIEFKVMLHELTDATAAED